MFLLSDSANCLRCMVCSSCLNFSEKFHSPTDQTRCENSQQVLILRHWNNAGGYCRHSSLHCAGSSFATFSVPALPVLLMCRQSSSCKVLQSTKTTTSLLDINCSYFTWHQLGVRIGGHSRWYGFSLCDGVWRWRDDWWMWYEQDMKLQNIVVVRLITG